MSVMISKLISKEGEQIEEKHHEGIPVLNRVYF